MTDDPRDPRDLRLTPQRQAVLNVLRTAGDHPSAGEVFNRVRRVRPGIGPATVYRSLARLVEGGYVRELSFGDGGARYDANTDRHDHLICDGCRRAVEVDLPVPDSLVGAAAEHTGFVVRRYDLQFRGLCPGCQPPAPDRSTALPPASPVLTPAQLKESPRMSTLVGTQTHENLKEAFAGESQANRRYLYFARQAKIENLPEIEELFQETAKGETGHAFGHLDFLVEAGDPATGEAIGDTVKNLGSAVAGETYEFTAMYPGFAKTAREEGFEEIADWFATLARAEKTHAGRFRKGLEKVAGTATATA